MSERTIGGYSEERGLSKRFLAEFLPVFYSYPFFAVTAG